MPSWIWGGLAGGLIALLISLSAPDTPRRDDSDAIDGPRSNMQPLTDHLTGCQYLTTRWGGITPRMSDEGRQICREDLTNK